MKISLCMIVKNEEENIANCLDRALKIVDEAIIVDTGSTDNTMKILIDNYGENNKVKVIEYEWENDFSKARNKSLEHATGDWILVLDADERIFCDRKRLEEFLNNRVDKAYVIPIYNVIDRENITVTSTMTRLFKNNNPIYYGAIHEQIYIEGKNFIANIIDGDICKIYHYGYTGAVFKEKSKWDRNMSIINAQIEKEPDVPFHWYNKGVMEMCRGNYETAIDDFIKSHNLSNKRRMAYHNDLVIRLIQCMAIEKKYKMAIEFVKTVINDPYIREIPDVYYYCGIIYANMKEYALAIEYFSKAIEKGEYDKGVSKYGAGSFLPKIEWAKVLLVEGKKEEAIAKYKEAVFDDYNVNKQGLEELKFLLKGEHRIEELNQLEKDLLKSKKIKADSNKDNLLRNDNFRKFSREVKDNIQLLVQDGILKEAKEAIKEYESIVENDVDIYSIKGVIAMMEGDMDEAEQVFIRGLTIEPFHNDIIYNLAYLYESQEKYLNAYEYYNKLLKVTKDETLVNEIKEKLKELSENETIKSIISVEKKDRNAPVITIETWVYNVEKYLEECIESVLNQSFKDFEWVIIDNGSTDKSSEILEKYAQKDKRIKLFKNRKNTFIYNEPMNLEFVKYTENLSSEYWCMLDSDDYLHRDFIKELYHVAKEYNVDVVVAGTEMFSEENPEQKGLRCPPDFYTKDITSLGDFYPEIYGCFRPIWGKLFKVSVLKKQLEYNKINLKHLMKNGADTIFCIDFLKHCNSVAGINKTLHNYRIRKNSLYNSMIDKKRYLQYIRIYEDSRNLLQSWDKLNDKNSYFITAVLYHSMKDCIDIAINAEKASYKDRIEVITTILEDKKLRELLNYRGLFITLLDDGLKAINYIVN